MTDEPLSRSRSPLLCALSLRIQDETCRHTKHDATQQSWRVKCKDLAPVGTQVKGCQGAQHQAVRSKCPPSPYGRSGCMRFDNKPSSSIATLCRGTACISHHHHTLLLPPSKAGASVLESAEKASVAGWPHARAWSRATTWHGRHHGPSHPEHPATTAWLQFQTGEGKIRGMRGNKKKSSPSSHKGRRGRAGGESERRRARCSPAVTPGEQSESEQPY